MSHIYDHNYKEKAFWIWYNEGQIPAYKLVIKLRETDDVVPNNLTIQNWMRDSWNERAEELNKEVKDKFSKEMIETKVEMLRRHADIGKELQDVGMEWIRENKDLLTAAAVTRIIKDGYEMEKASVGVPEALQKMLATSDEDLVKQIEAALTGEDVDLLDAD